MTPQGRIADRVVEQIVEASVRKIREQIVGVVKVILQEHLRQHIEEVNIDRLVPQIDEEIVEGVPNIPQESILERVAEKFIVVRGPRSSLKEEHLFLKQGRLLNNLVTYLFHA